MKNRSTILKGITIVLTAVIIASCGNSNAKKRRRGQRVLPYPVLEVQPRSITLNSKYPATLRGSQTIQIRPRVPGFITAIPVSEGDVVEKGEVLFRLNAEEYQQQVQTAKVKVSQAKNNLEQIKPLVEQDIVSEFQLQEAKLGLEAAKAALITAKQNLSYATIESPVDGVMGKIPYKVGALVSSSITQPLTTVSDITTMYAYFSMSESELLEMALRVSGEGQNQTLGQLIAEMPPAQFKMANGMIYKKKGTLKLASGLIDTQTGSAYFKAVFPNPKQILRSGGSGNVIIPVPLDSAIVIPKSATYEIQKKRFVYTLTDSNTVESTVINTMQLSTPRMFVVTDGIKPGSTIITTGLSTLTGGKKIKPQPVNADSLYKALQSSTGQNR